MESLSSRIALVTGSSRGIGREIAVALAAAGADVAVNYRSNEKEAEETCARIKAHRRRALPVRADVSLGAEVGRMADLIQREFGPVSILVNNAGIARPQPPDQITEQDWDEVLQINLKSAFLATRAFLPGMRAQRWGRIIHLSSVAAQTGGVVGPHYAASKAGLLGLTHSYASLFAAEGITVNAIAPALIETDMIKGGGRFRPDRLPVGRFGTPGEVAEVAVMLARNGFITGQTINVNGG
ncbi:MAG TPA: SDR family NAD(P)-dependent oxidoreductase, partial [Candidatus Manganitrophaceae bacterium]|nr:SDR family NAD(P)-dependent oxidoreductase [Candidatus Manganitrophaceae bacterium]